MQSFRLRRFPEDGLSQFTRVLAKSTEAVNFVRGLRFRLAAGFLIFFTLLLIGLGLVVREVLENIVRGQVYALLDEEWAAAKGYLRIEDQTAIWYVDRFDPEESLIVNRITAGGPYLFADANANIIDRSTMATNLGIATTEQVRRLVEKAPHSPQPPLNEVRQDGRGTEYVLKYGMMPDKQHRFYLLVIGRSLGDSSRTVNQFTWRYFALMPLLLLLCAGVGWVVAGRALVPVTELAQAAQRITSSNLNVRIPLRGSGDELDRLIRSFNLMVLRLNKSFEQTRQFSTDVSHELRTPLTAIRGQLEVALFTAETPDQFRDAMANALQDVEHLSSIVKALLLLSQAESGQLALQMAPVDLSAIVRDIMEQFLIPAEEGQIRLESDCIEDIVVHGDKVQLSRLVSNLLSNAIKYTKPGGAVRVGLGQREGSATFWVEDTGIGIPAEKLPHIFDRFYRVRRSESNPVQGLGLGLSFVSWIVTAHGGKVEVDSTEGQGTRFTVSLPMAGLAAESSGQSVPDHARL